ncbi:MAG: cadherin-like beta sandwich domain-containing protein [Verrucomicrobiaceae bacterium]|nr:cadherin-like beta sandwich domain-containing protein [Verrucomicrobiaceae bacterium]
MFRFAASLFLLVLCCLPDAADAIGTWVPLTTPAGGGIGLMLLMSDGTVMAHRNNTTTWYKLTPDSAGHYVNGTWTTLQSMHDSRLYYSSQVLMDGRVFVAGGEYGTGYRTGESYNPMTNKWTMAPPITPSQGISDACSEILPDGRVLVAPVSASPFLSTQIWNPATNTWTAGPSVLGNQNEAVWVKLPDDSLLTVDIGSTSSERYIPSLNQWIADATVPVSLYDPYGFETGGGFMLPNGKAFFLGSLSHTAIYTPSGNNSPGTWVAGPDIPGPSGTPDAPAVMLPNGKILCAVSPVPTSANHFPSPTTFYEYDYVANSFTAVPTPTGATLNHASYFGTMLCLPDGTALYADFGSQVYCYQPDGSPIPAGKPTITTITQNVNGTFHLVGTQLNGISEGSSYGDDNQNNSNYPIVRLTSGGGTVYHARTFNWSRTSVQTGATPVSTEFSVPQTIPSGTYALTVIANGIPSDPTSFNVSPILVSVPSSATEGGAAVNGTVTLPTAPASDTTVTLTSSHTARATVPASVTVLAGQTTAAFAFTPGNDALLNGAQSVGISAAAGGYQTGISYITILDDESAVLAITPSGSTTFTGNFGGPFTPASATYTLTNNGNMSLDWAMSKSSSAWLSATPASGTLAAGASVTLTLTLTSSANTQAIGSYSATLTFNNNTTGDGNTTRTVNLTVTGAPVMSVTAGSLDSTGPTGGVFTPSSTTFTISNSGTGTLSWTATKTQSWLTLSPASGSIAAGSTGTLTATIGTGANSLAQGSYSDTITITNTANGNGNTTRAVALLVQSKAASYSLTTDPGWSKQGEWAYGTPTGGGGGTGTFADPTAGYTGTKVFGVNLAGNYSTTPGGPYYLTLGPVNLTGYVAAKVRFRRWLNTDFQPYAYATVEVSNDGTTWTSVYDNGTTAATTDSSWQLVQYDISAVANNKPAVYIRWGYQVGASATAMSGWNIDDVDLIGSTGITTPTATPQTVAVAFGTTTPFTVAGVDTNTPASPLTFAVATQPSHGTLGGSAPNLTYTPAIGWHGADTFTFTCTNGFNLTSAPATVTLNTAVGAPVADPQLASVPTNTATAITLTASDPNVPALSLTYNVTSSPAHGTLSGTAPNLTFTPTTGYTGADSFTFTVSNGTVTSATATVTLNIGIVSVAEQVVTPGLIAGNNPRSRLVIGPDGNFYGTTLNGGSSGQGAIFKMTTAGVMTTLVNFYGANGAQPQGGLALGNDGFLYGTTQLGGANNLGTIFRVSTAGSLTTLVHCTTLTGTTPKAALVQASDNNFYGSTTAGGTSSNGTLFKMTPAGVLTVLVNLTGTTSTAYGSNVQAAMIQGLDGNLYGVCGGGGAGSNGTIFKLTTGGAFTTLVSFTGATGAAIGGTPLGALVQDSGGVLYGTTSTSGTGSNGTIFSCTTAGVLTTLQSFTGSTGAVLGGNCQGPLAIGSDGLLYGVTVGGTTSGSLFKITTTGTFTSIRSLTSTTDGLAPFGGVVLAGDGNFYGTTSGTSNGSTTAPQFAGTFFQLVPSTSTFTRLAIFPYAPPTYRSLVKHSDGNFYGVVLAGGANSNGSVIKLTPSGTLTTLVSFNITNGAQPNSLIEGTDGNLYGTCQRGGTNNIGTVFKVTTAGVLTTLVNLTSSTQGSTPLEALTAGGDGNYYGTCSSGGTSSQGSVFKITPSGTFTTLALFTGTAGAYPGSSPQTRLMLAGDGNLYGTTNSSGTGGSSGTIFRVNVAAGTVTSLASFTGTAGAVPGNTPATNLLLGSDGKLYGTTNSGGAGNFGTIYSITTGGVFTSLASFTGTTGAALGTTPSSNVVEGADGSLYGTTTTGGTSSVGTAYRCTKAGVFTSLASFTGTTGAFVGNSPQGMIRQAADGWFYGTTSSGGFFNLGTIYRFHPSGQAQSLFTFGNSADGGPQNQTNITMISRACQFIIGGDGYLYGGNGGAIFRIHQQPAAQTIASSNVTPDAATLTASVIPNQDNATVYFQYGVSTAYGSQTAPQNINAGNAPVNVNAALAGLQSGVVYHFRLVTVTQQGTFYSGDFTFATPGAPLVITGSYVAAGQTGISVDGQVNPLGDTTLYWFEYGDEPGNYEHNTAPVSVGGGEPVVVEPGTEDPQNASNGVAWIPVRATINLLAPGEVHFRLVASNGYGLSYGEDQKVDLLPPTNAVLEPTVQYVSTGTAPQAPLFLGNDGYLYGTTSAGGTAGLGTAFRISGGGTLTTLGNFYGNLNGENNPSGPQGSLAQGADGSFYGTTNLGGTGNGAIFKMTSGGAISTIVSLSSNSGNFLGSNPINGLTLGADGSLYGVTQNGGTPNFGTIFKVTTSGVFTTLVSFNGTSGTNLGSSPRGNLILASDGSFYGTTATGGAGGFGTVFKYAPPTLTLPSGLLTTLVQFTGTTGAAMGSTPTGGLVQGIDGNFYGTTSAGGANNLGTVFMMTPAGTITTLVHFSGIVAPALGSSPKGSLVQGSDGAFYGTTQTGGLGGGFGTIFKVTPAGVLTTIASCTGTTGSAPLSSPNGGLVPMPDGSFYGTSSSGGFNNQGTVFKFTPDGLVSVLLHCTAAPVISKLTQTSDGKFFGTTTAAGGANGWGSAFSIAPTESPLFLAPLPPTSGTAAISSRGGFMIAANGELWATSSAGGAGNNGSVFKMTQGGNVTTVISFTGTSGTNPGSSPQAALILGADGNHWGTTSGGGSGTSGTIFKVTPAGVQTVVINFTGTSGANLGSSPQAPLLLAADGNYYGSTTTGGNAGGFGTIFKLTPAGVLTTLVNLTGNSGTATGSSPQGPMVQGADGNFYGVTNAGGVNGLGTVFKVTPAGVFTSLASFTGTTGALRGQNPTAGLFAGGDGQFYGTTSSGGLYNFGTVFRVASDGSVTSLCSFTGRSDGISPANGGLVLAADGLLHGGNSMGTFRLHPPPVPLASPATNVLASSATLNGTITGESFSGTMWFEYGPGASYGFTTPAQNFTPGLTAAPVSAPLTGLQPLLAYHYRLVASCAQGTFAGPDATFTTSSTATFNALTDVPVTVDGFTASGITLNVALGFAPAPGAMLTLVNSTGVTPVSGTFNGLPNGAAISATFNSTTYLFAINYSGGDGNDITLTRVDQVITFPPIPMKSTSDVPFALNATASSGLTVSYQIVAGGTVASVSGSTVTLTGTAGTVVVKATQPGNGTTIGAAPPVYQTFAVSTAGSGFVQITTSKSNDFALGIRANGTLWGWGLNTSNYLGDGTTTTRRTPVQIGTATNWSSVSAGGSHCVALQSDGTMWAWGLNSDGRVGNGTNAVPNTTTQSSPVQIGTSAQLGVPKTWVLASAGTSHTVAVASDGTLWAWGGNGSGQLGQGTTDSLAHSVPTQISGATAQTAAGSLGAGGDFTLVIQTDGKLYGWGTNGNGQIGDGTTTSPRSVLTVVGTATTWSKVSAGSAFTTALRTDGTLWTWGLNSSGQLGDGSLVQRTAPVQVGTATNWSTLHAGATWTFARKTDNTLWSWGANASGQLGQGFADGAARGNAPAQVGSDATWTTAAAGVGVSLAAKADGTLWAWGTYSNGQQGVVPRIPLPLAPSLGPVTSVAGGGASDVVMRPDGSTLAWGSNSSGQLALGATDSAPHPQPVTLGAGSQWRSLSMGASTTIGVRNDGTLWGCGLNSSGQIGDGTTVTRPALVQIGTDTDWLMVCTGSAHTLALKTDGSLWAWGSNSSSQLGDGTAISRLTPTRIGTDTNWRTVIATNGSFSIGMKTDGTIWTWGLNTNGQIGDGTNTTRTRPGQVGTDTDWKSVVGGTSHVLVLKNNGTLWGWGLNGNGQLGDGTTTQRTSPAQTGSVTTWSSIAAGVTHSLGVRSNGTLWAWGLDSSGQLGDAAFANRTSPTQVGTSTSWLSLPVASLSTASHSLVMAVDRSLWTCGLATNGQTGFAGRNLFTPELAVPGLGAAQTITFSPPASVPVGNTITLGAASSSGLPASYLVTGPAVRNGEQLTITGAGLVTVIAYQPGDSYWQSSDMKHAFINAPAPTVTTLAATSIGTTTATLSATINPNGSATTAQFQHGGTASYGTNTAVTLSPANDTMPQNAAITLTGLTPGTTYHFRATATNGIGTTNGDDVTFTTISNNADLASLALSSGTASPSGPTSYTASVSNATVSITITPATSNAGATFTINGGSNTTLPLTVGVNNFTIVVTAQDGVTTKTYTLAITRRTPFEDWALANSVTGTNSAPAADYDNDGIPNLIEWAFGLNAALAGNASLALAGNTLTGRGGPVTMDTPGGRVAVFCRRLDYLALGLTYTVEFSADLSSWTASTATPTPLANDGIVEAVSVPYPDMVGGQPARFFRVKVTAQ